MSVSTLDSSPDTAPIFVIGSGRSGTTLMRYILNAHPDIYIAEEICFHFWMMLFKGPLPQRLYRYFGTFSFAWLKLDPQRVLAALPKDLSMSDNAAVYTQILRSKAAQYGKQRFGEKGPLLIMALEQLFRDYPNARVIHMLRDPRAIVHSHTRMPWSTASLTVASYIVRDNMETIDRYGERILWVKLEELIAQPETEMRRVLKFVDVKWSDHVLQHSAHLPPDDGIPFPWLKEATRSAQQKHNAWQDALSPAWIRLIESANRATMQRFGYAPHALAREPSFGEKWCAVMADLPRALQLVGRSLRVIVLLLFSSRMRARELQALMHSTNPGAWKLHSEWDEDLPEPPEMSPPRYLFDE